MRDFRQPLLDHAAGIQVFAALQKRRRTKVDALHEMQPIGRGVGNLCALFQAPLSLGEVDVKHAVTREHHRRGVSDGAFFDAVLMQLISGVVKDVEVATAHQAQAHGAGFQCVRGWRLLAGFMGFDQAIPQGQKLDVGRRDRAVTHRVPDVLARHGHGRFIADVLFMGLDTCHGGSS